MAYEQVPEMFELAKIAGADLRGKVGFFVKIDVDGRVILASAATDNVLGVIREDGNTNDPVTILLGGIGKAVSAGTIAAGAYITVDGTGKAVSTTNAGDRVVGQALEAGVDAADVFSFRVCNFNY